MADFVSPTTELDAVNEILRVIGESPVSSLDDALPVDADNALRALRAVSREVQSRGWHFNTEARFPLTLDSSGYLQLPGNTLRVDSVGDDQCTDVVQRGTRLYDRREHTYVFSRGLTADLVLALAFDELPETARSYITIRAARRFQAGALGSIALNSFAQAEEDEARAYLIQAETETADYNILTDNMDTFQIVSREGGVVS